MNPTQQNQTRPARIDGTLDGNGAGDHDLPFRFGHKPSSSQPCPFSTHQYVRLLILRSRIQARAVKS